MKSHAIFVALALLVTLSAVILASMTFGKGGRGYFSPDTFDVKWQSEYLVPFTDVPIYRSSFAYGPNSSELVQFLVDKGYWSALATDKPEWVPTFRWNQQWRGGDSDFYRTMTRRAYYWIEWSEAHPELAKALWPLVLDILRNGIDDGAVMQVTHYARISSTVDEFRNWVNNDPELQTRSIRL